MNDCTTQRNLDGTGREQARALGAAFRKQGVRVDRILSSPVCRCLETGQLMAIGSVETSWALLPDTGPSPVRFLELKEIVSSWPNRRPRIHEGEVSWAGSHRLNSDG
jgi:phosphohistidine phosphatase SixA